MHTVLPAVSVVVLAVGMNTLFLGCFCDRTMQRWFCDSECMRIVIHCRLQEYNNTDQFRDRTPTSIVYLADEEDVDAAFVGFASGPQPLVQVLPGLSSGNSDCTAETCAVLSIQRMFVSEQVSLMKGFSLDIEGSDDAASLLLVTGRQVAEPSTAPSAAAAAGGAATLSEAELQFSIYSYVRSDPANRMQVRLCAAVPV